MQAVGKSFSEIFVSSDEELSGAMRCGSKESSKEVALKIISCDLTGAPSVK